MSSRQQFCTFLVEAHWFGTPVDTVQEVMPPQEMTRVPLAPAVVRGMINLRGQIVPAIDLRRRLGLPDLATGQLPMNVIVRAHEGPVSLLVDEIGDVMEVAKDTLEMPPATLEGFAGDVVQGVYQLPGRLLLALDVDRVADLGDLARRPGGTHTAPQSSSAKTQTG